MKCPQVVKSEPKWREAGRCHVVSLQILAIDTGHILGSTSSLFKQYFYVDVFSGTVVSMQACATCQAFYSIHADGKPEPWVKARASWKRSHISWETCAATHSNIVRLGQDMANPQCSFYFLCAFCPGRASSSWAESTHVLHLCMSCPAVYS